jgi:hypothetical protein
MITGEIPKRSMKSIVSGILPSLSGDDLKSFGKLGNMIEQCTVENPKKRPTFSQLLKELS